jgi:hypothetical protein
MRHFGVGDPRPEGEWKRYRKVAITEIMGPMTEEFTCDARERKGYKGQPGDFVAEDGHGGYYVISGDFHRENYEEVVQGAVARLLQRLRKNGGRLANRLSPRQQELVFVLIQLLAPEIDRIERSQRTDAE